MTDFEITSIFESFCSEYGLSIRLNWNMPFGYETAYGTYDVTINTLFLNLAVLENAPKYEILFYLFHELRHAMQYLHPQDFAEEIQSSQYSQRLIQPSHQYNDQTPPLLGAAVFSF